MGPKTIIKEPRFMENNTAHKSNSKGVLEDKFQDFWKVEQRLGVKNGRER